MRRAVGTGVALAVVVGGLGYAQQRTSIQKLDPQRQIVQALNRLTWGVQPGDVEAVQKIGLTKWVDQQLHPSSIPEDPELAAALAPLDSLRMSPEEMMRHYPPAPVIRQMALGRRPLPSDPKLRAVVEREIERAKEAKDARDAKEGKPAPRPQLVIADGDAEQDAPPLDQILTPEQVQALETGNPRMRVAELEGLPSDTRDLVLASLPRMSAQQLAPWVPIGQQHQIAYNLNPQQVTTLDLLGAKVLRAVYSHRQLEDVLTDFWFNHFNIHINKGQDRELITAYERDAIRPHVLGKFRELLLATAKSPAMLFYLDNWQSVDPNANLRGRGRFAALTRPAPRARPTRGINENYGRELMELQTLGVNGGYTQKDVTEVARCFTGWTIEQPLRKATFFYNDNLHDKGAKVVLGVKISAGGGMSDGLKVIEILSRSPATARHISYELAQRFVADEPPAALVDRMAAAFLKSAGDLRRVMEAMIRSPEFWQAGYYRDKVKSPLEMVVSAVRALGADVSNPTRLTQLIAAMGQPLYAKEPPTGYENVGAAWVSSSGLIARLNFALRLAANQIPGVQVDLSPFASGEPTLPEVEQSLLQGLLYDQASAGTKATIERVAAPNSAPGTGAPPATPAQIQQIAGLILGSPDFQRR